MKLSRAPIGAFIVATLVLCVGCTSNPQTGTAEASHTNSSSNPSIPEIEQLKKIDEIAAMVPEEIRNKGVLNIVGTEYPSAIIPQQQGQRPLGWEPAMSEAIGKILGLETHWDVIEFPGVIPGLLSNRWDIAMSGMSVTPERRKQLVFVPDSPSTSAIAVQQTSAFVPAAPHDLCGHTVAVQNGSISYNFLQTVQPQCDGAGKQKINILTAKDQSSANLSVESGRADAVMGGMTTIAYMKRLKPNTWKSVDFTSYLPQNNYVGVGIPPKPYGEDLARPIAAAINELIKNGAMQAIMDEWNEGAGVLKKTEVLPLQDK